MSNPTQLAPWAHPKAQKWFETILEKSGFIEEIEEQVNQQTDLLDVESGRMLLAMLVLLGRPGIWPAQHKMVLARAANRVDRLAKGQANGANGGASKPPSNKPLTIREHQQQSTSVTALQEEVEIVRRWGGASKRKTKIDQPESWGEFWR